VGVLAAECAEHPLQRVVAVDLVVAVAHHQHCREVRNPAPDEAQDVQRRVVGPVRVLDDQDRR